MSFEDEREKVLRQHREARFWLIIAVLACVDWNLYSGFFTSWYSWIVPVGLIAFILLGERLARRLRD